MFSLSEEDRYERRLDRLDAEKHDVLRERDDLRQVGDMLQSEASRLAEFVNALGPAMVPYEVQQAMLGVRSAVAQWTDVRRESVSGR